MLLNRTTLDRWLREIHPLLLRSRFKRVVSPRKHFVYFEMVDHEGEEWAIELSSQPQAPHICMRERYGASGKDVAPLFQRLGKAAITQAELVPADASRSLIPLSAPAEPA